MRVRTADAPLQVGLTIQVHAMSESIIGFLRAKLNIGGPGMTLFGGWFVQLPVN